MPIGASDYANLRFVFICSANSIRAALSAPIQSFGSLHRIVRGMDGRLFHQANHAPYS